MSLKLSSRTVRSQLEVVYSVMLWRSPWQDECQVVIGLGAKF